MESLQAEQERREAAERQVQALQDRLAVLAAQGREEKEDTKAGRDSASRPPKTRRKAASAD